MTRIKVDPTLDADGAKAARALGLNMSRPSEAAKAEEVARSGLPLARFTSVRGARREAEQFAAIPGLTPQIGWDSVVRIVRMRGMAAVPGTKLTAGSGSPEGHRCAS